MEGGRPRPPKSWQQTATEAHRPPKNRGEHVTLRCYVIYLNVYSMALPRVFITENMRNSFHREISRGKKLFKQGADNHSGQGKSEEGQ